VESVGHGTVKIYASQSLVDRFLMPCFVQMARAYPNMRTDLHIAAGRQVERALVHDLADFAMVVTAPNHADIEIVAERSNRIVAVVSPSHPLATARQVDLAELMTMPFAALPSTYTSRVVFNALATTQQRDGQPQMTANSIPVLKAYARSGIGVAIMPEVAVWQEDRDGDLIPIPIAGMETSATRMCLCRRRSRILGPAAERFLLALIADFSADHGGR
jgi:DNA-binding transcriptional LysR family regulator